MKKNRNIKSKFITDPIHGEIEFTENEHWLYELTQTKEFKRLLNIRQLGECYHVFYSATHTRFSHSIGVFNVCKMFLSHLKLEETISKDDYNCILAVALLHDIGHGPMSHSFEMYTNHNHEDMTIKIIKSPKTEINKILVKNKINIEKMVDIMEHRNIPNFYYQIVSSQIDSDRLDYLLRDSYYVGTKNGQIDIGIIIKWSLIDDDNIAFNKKAISLLETILFARYQMFKQIYLNPKTVCYEEIVKMIFKRLLYLKKNNFEFKDSNNLLYFLNPFFNGDQYDIETFLKLDDLNFLTLLKSLLNEDDDILKKLCSSYFYSNEFICSKDKPDDTKIDQCEYFHNEFILKNSFYDPDEAIYVYDVGEATIEDVKKYFNIFSSSNLQKPMKEKFYFYKLKN